MPITVMLVDDSAVSRKVLIRTLRQAGLDIDDIVEAMDGLEALELLRTVDPIDLVLCACNMPNMDGAEFVSVARAEGFRGAIVMLTTESSGKCLEEALDGGADGYVAKPFTPERLSDALTPLLASAR